MSWETDLVLTLRVLLGDLNAPQKNTDSYLQSTLIAAGILANNEIDFTYDYVFDIAGNTITPDPVDIGDAMAQAVLPLKAACILNQSQFQTALGQGIKVRDGDSAIDTSVSFGGYKDILRYGPCAAYDKLVWQIKLTNSGTVGGFVLSPYRGPNDAPINTVSWFYDEFYTYFNGVCRQNRGF